MPILTPEEYKKQAASMYDDGYATKVANAMSGFNNQMAQYGNQANVINNNFTKSVADTNRNTALNQNQFNNNTLSRGMARSSIATTGLAGIQNTGNRVVGELEVQKNQDLNSLESLKSALRENLTATLNGYSADRETGINSLATQLKQRAEDMQYRDDAAAEDKRRYEQNRTDNEISEARQTAKETYEKFMANERYKAEQETEKTRWETEQAENKRRWEAEQASKNSELEWDKDKFAKSLALDYAQLNKASSSGSSGSATTSKKSLMPEITSNVQEAIKDGNGIEYIQAMTPEWIAAGLDMSDINALRKYAEDFVRTPDEIKAASQRQNNRRPADYGL